MKRAIVAAALIGALLPAVPARAAAGTLVGVGSVEGSLCSGTVLLHGVGVNVPNVVGSNWLFTAEIILDRTTGPCTILLVAAAAYGPWNPASGGCVPTPGLICVGPVPQGGPHTTGVSICPAAIAVGCFQGSVTVVRV